jgi:hypothetical protein
MSREITMNEILNLRYIAWAETHIELLQAGANAISQGDYANAATAIERASKGMATMGAAIRAEAKRKESSSV